MNTKGMPGLDLRSGDIVIIAVDVPVEKRVDAKNAGESFKREYFVCRGSDLLVGSKECLNKWESLDAFLANGNSGMSGETACIVIYPTRTYSGGFRANLFSDIAPEDRHVFRRVRRIFREGVVCCKIPLKDTQFFRNQRGYFLNDGEESKYEKERNAAAEVADTQKTEKGRSLVEFDSRFLVNIKKIFVSCMTRPNGQDYTYLITKTYGLNLIVRLVFVIRGVMNGGLPLIRAILSTSWYQLQDTVFTIFGQTYMRFLGKMTGLVRIHNTYVGDFIFVYVQLCFFEFLNRLLLGPLGGNPLVYTWGGIGLIFMNILQGMISGGPLIPAINQMRKAGAISHSTMMHLYQLSSLTMQFGLFASFGYQGVYAVLTGGTLVFAWSSYVIFSTFFKDPVFVKCDNKDVIRRLDDFAISCCQFSWLPQ